MDDKDILEKLEKYEKKELEIDSNYNIKKEELSISVITISSKRCIYLL